MNSRWVPVLKQVWRKHVNRTRVGVSMIILAMTYLTLMTQMCDEANCSRRNYRRDYHIIMMPFNFHSESYLSNVEEILRAILPEAEKAGMQMPFLRPVFIFNKTHQTKIKNRTLNRGLRKEKNLQTSNLSRKRQYVRRTKFKEKNEAENLETSNRSRQKQYLGGTKLKDKIEAENALETSNRSQQKQYVGGTKFKETNEAENLENSNRSRRNQNVDRTKFQDKDETQNLETSNRSRRRQYVGGSRIEGTLVLEEQVNKQEFEHLLIHRKKIETAHPKAPLVDMTVVQQQLPSPITEVRNNTKIEKHSINSRNRLSSNTVVNGHNNAALRNQFLPPTTKEKQEESSPEVNALQDFRLRAQRIARLCPTIVKNVTTSRNGKSYFKMWKSAAFSMSKAETVKGVFRHKQSQTSYCFVPKAGCTFWIRVFAFLQNFTGLQAQSPWDIPRLTVHTKRNNPNAQGSPLWYFEKEVMAPGSLRFLVTRDPYARLWSAYVDKLLLPDFWANIGIFVVRRFRKKPTVLAKKCGHDVTFSEFIQFALTTPNSHWEPIHKRCDPCRYQPQVIADMDTFARDSTVVLRRMGIEDVLSHVNRTMQKERELRTLIQYNFDVINSTSHYNNCVTPVGVARLLWKAFQINGYLPVQNIYCPSGPEENFSVTKFTDHVITVFRNSESLAHQLKVQKQYFMEDAYRSLSPELLNKLKEVYSLDFKLFGYDESPFTA